MTEDRLFSFFMPQKVRKDDKTHNTLSDNKKNTSKQNQSFLFFLTKLQLKELKS